MSHQNSLLRQFPFLSSMSDGALGALAATLAEQRLQKGELLFAKGDVGDSMGFVVSGRLSVTMDPNDPTKEVAAIYPGEVVGEMACVDSAPRSATVLATRPSVVLELNRNMLHALQQNGPAIAVAIQSGIISLLTRRIRDTNARVEQKIEVGQHQETEPPNVPKTPRTDENIAPPRVDLRSLECLEGFTIPELKTLVKQAPPRTYPPGSTLFNEGNPGDSCAIIAAGTIHVIRRIAGHERILATLGAGTMVGQMALVDHSPRSATIRVAEKAVILCLRRTAFESLLAQNSPMAIRFQHQIAVAGARQLRLANAKLEEFSKRLEAAPVKTPSPKTRPGSAPAKAVPTPRKSEEISEEISEEQLMWSYMQTALNEWGLSVSELDQIEVSRPDGIMSNAELRTRQNI